MLANVQIAKFPEINSIYYTVKAVGPKEKPYLLERTYSPVYEPSSSHCISVI
jgi:hypothetical protein